MIYRIEVTDYNREAGLSLIWEKGYELSCLYKDNCIQITANNEGLITLARHLLSLAQNDIPSGYHIQLDELNGLNEGSTEIIIEKM